MNLLKLAKKLMKKDVVEAKEAVQTYNDAFSRLEQLNKEYKKSLTTTK